MKQTLYVPLYRIQLVREGRQRSDNREVRTPDDAANIMKRVLQDADREMFVIAGLSVKNEVIGLSVVSIGTLDSAIVHPREVFKAALLMNAASVIVAHVHPSGDPEPSPEDRIVTERLVRAGKILGIEVCDHIVIGEDTFVSLRERGLMSVA